MSAAARDYRTVGGVARCRDEESVLAKYIRVARVEAPHLSLNHPLPIERPQIGTGLAAADYLTLLSVLDELVILEAAARFADRKAADIARRRLYRAIATEAGCRPAQVERLNIRVDRLSVPILRSVASVILPNYKAAPEPVPTGSQTGGKVLPFRIHS